MENSRGCLKYFAYHCSTFARRLSNVGKIFVFHKKTPPKSDDAFSKFHPFYFSP
jgi:hypothetical protein